MPKDPIDELKKYQWEPCPAGQQIVSSLVETHLAGCPESVQLAASMKALTGTRFVDWLDHLVTDQTDLVPALEAAGFTRESGSADIQIFEHRGAIFPHILIDADTDGCSAALKVESVADFLAAHSLSGKIEGHPFAPLRRATAWGNQRAGGLTVIERHGDSGFQPAVPDSESALASQHHLEVFRTRRRNFASSEEAFAAIHLIVDSAIEDLGPDRSADAWFAAERDFWMRRNRAARVQKARQDALGLGWANHDHHTYRCRRDTFARIVEVLEKLGCFCRERFHAGAEAGWGAQILEQPTAGVIVFADVDMDATEVSGDFSHEGFPQRDGLGTVGLWCELHGESFVGAGMHHLECQFDFEALAAQMRTEAGIGMMKPFTDFDYLRQQFTEGERWQVKQERLDPLLKRGHITPEQADRFRSEGAIGSHLENLERNDGFKGFNQTGINEIILATDPRNQIAKGQ